MATLHAAAEMRGRALIKLTLAMRAISQKTKIAPAELPSLNGHDPIMTQAKLIDALADWTEQVAVKLGVKPEELSEYSGIRKAQLIKVAADRELTFDPDNVTVAELKDLLEADDQRRADNPDFYQMTVKELKAFAADKQIDLGDATKRDDIITKLIAPPQVQGETGQPETPPEPGTFEEVTFSPEGKPLKAERSAKLDGSDLAEHERLQGKDLTV